MYRFFPCIPILGGGGGVLKIEKRMCIGDYVKNHISTC